MIMRRMGAVTPPPVVAEPAPPSRPGQAPPCPWAFRLPTSGPPGTLPGDPGRRPESSPGKPRRRPRVETWAINTLFLLTLTGLGPMSV